MVDGLDAVHVSAFARYRLLLVRYVWPLRGWVVVLVVVVFLGVVLQLLKPQVIRFFLDTAQAGGALDELLAAGVFFVVVGLVQHGCVLVGGYVGERIMWAATNALRVDMAGHCLQLGMAFHKQFTPGELIERIDGDVTVLGDFFSGLVVRAAAGVLLVVAILVLLLCEDWRIGVGLVGYTVLTLVVLRLVHGVGVTRWDDEREASAAYFGFLEERLSGTEDVRANGGESYVLGRMGVLVGDMVRSRRAAEMAGQVTFASTSFLFLVGYALGLALGVYLFAQGVISLGTAYVLVFYIGLLSEPLSSVRDQARGFQRAAASMDRVALVLGFRSQVQAGGQVVLPSGALAVEVRDVWFRYDDEVGGTVPLHGVDGGAMVLRGVSFRLEPGCILGLLGRSGSGKTTLTRLLFRLYVPSVGGIWVGGEDLCLVEQAELRARVGLVTQDVQLFQASLRDNVALFNPHIDDGQIVAALRALGLWEWVQMLPDGLDTRLGAGGLGLSSGEAQLLAFTRVFLRDPGLVVLDEASSRLDPATERLLEVAIDRLLVGRTGIVIAHRLRTVQRADTILILDDGEVVECGRRVELAVDSGSRFYRLLLAGLEEVLV